MESRIKIKDIASRLGVSATLVSLVLNNKANQQGIKRDTQEKVLTIARKMGYFDSNYESDKLLPSDENTGMVGMMVNSLNDQFIFQVSPFIRKSLEKFGLDLSIIPKDQDIIKFDRLPGLYAKFFSGLILTANSSDDKIIAQLKNKNYPFILLENKIKNKKINSVYTDNIVGSDLIANHIYRMGYEKIIVAVENSLSDFYLSDIQFLIHALQEKNDKSKIEVVKINNKDDVLEIDREKFDKLLRPPFSVEVIITMNAGIVYPLMSYLNLKAIRIPQDVALVSMEEGTGFDVIFPPVTCLRKPLAAMGEKSASIIWSEIKNRGKGKYKSEVKITPELIVRKSCGCI